MTQSTADRIATEQSVIATAEFRVIDFEAKRKDALLSDDVPGVDLADSEIAAARIAIARARERIELLEQRLAEEADQQRNADLDALAASANAARVRGESVIKHYPLLALEIGELMQELASIDADIEQTNHKLRAANRPLIPSPNAIRCKPMVRGTRTERRRVGVGEESHPQHKDHEFDRNGNCRHRTTGLPIEPFGEFDIQVPYVEQSHQPKPLHVEVKLPRTDPDATHDYWPAPKAITPALSEAATESPGIVAKVRKLVSSRAA